VTRVVAANSRVSPALTILSILSIGFYSIVVPAIAIAISTYLAYNIGASTLRTYSELIKRVYAVVLSGVGRCRYVINSKYSGCSRCLWTYGR